MWVTQHSYIQYEINVFSHVTPSGLVNIYQHYRGMCYQNLHCRSRKMEAACSSKTLVKLQQTTQYHIFQYGNLQSWLRTSNLKKIAYIILQLTLIYIIHLSLLEQNFCQKQMISFIFCAISHHNNARPLCIGETVQFITVKELTFSTDIKCPSSEFMKKGWILWATAMGPIRQDLSINTQKYWSFGSLHIKKNAYAHLPRHSNWCITLKHV
jgi:hypothetical protein